jgi:low molecular weight phosphotyrosine protein phosphatase
MGLLDMLSEMKVNDISGRGGEVAAGKKAMTMVPDDLLAYIRSQNLNRYIQQPSFTPTAVMATSEAAVKGPKPVSVLFVCLGNICPSPAHPSFQHTTNHLPGRSTMAEGVFQSLTHSPPHPLIKNIDSCGTGAYHIGDSPDSRTMSTLRDNGITTYSHAARKFSPSTDFDAFAYIFAMDEQNLRDLERLREREVKRRGGDEEGVGRVMLFGEFGGKRKGEEVDDPYYGGNKGFTTAFEQCVRFGRAFLERLEKGELS